MITAQQKAAIARIDVLRYGDVVGHGSGVLIAPDEVLTALHVVADLEQRPLEALGDLKVRLRRTDQAVVEVTAELDADRYHVGLDWVVLRLSQAVEGIEPLVPSAAIGASCAFGFPDVTEANGALDGLAIELRTVDAHARWHDQEVLQLFSPQVAAARGLAVKGLSGAPVLGDGRVIGILRSALLEQDRAEGGVLYATAARDILAELRPAPSADDLPPLPAGPTVLGRAIQLDREKQWDALVKVCRQEVGRVVIFHGRSGQALYHFTTRIQRDLAREVDDRLRVLTVPYQPDGLGPSPTAAVWVGRLGPLLGIQNRTLAEAVREASDQGRLIVVFEAELDRHEDRRTCLESLVRRELPRLVSWRGRHPIHVVVALEYAQPEEVFVRGLVKQPPDCLLALPQTRFPDWDEVELFLDLEGVAEEVRGRVKRIHEACRTQHAEDFEALLQAVQTALDGGLPTLITTVLSRLEQKDLQQIRQLALACGLQNKRDFLLAPLPVGYVASLPGHRSPGDQLWSDMLALNGVPELIGFTGHPLAAWLRVAEQESHPRPESREFAEWARRLGG